MALTLLTVLSAAVSIVYLASMRSTPRRGLMRVVERVCVGMILCYLCHLAFGPLGAEVPRGPLASLAAGYLGLPGVALGTAVSLLP